MRIFLPLTCSKLDEEAKLPVVDFVWPQHLVDAPVQVEAEDGDPGEGADEDEVAVVADHGADVLLDELADGRGGGAVHVEGARLREVDEQQEAAEEGGEGDVDQHNLALEVVVAGKEPVDQEGDEKTDQADHRTD